MVETIKPKYFTGWNVSIMQLFGSGPKMTITCGKCSLTFSKRIKMVDNPGCQCPNCGAINILPLVVSDK